MPKEDVECSLSGSWNFRIMSCVSLPSSFQFLDKARVEVMERFEDSLIIDIDFAVCLVQNPSLDVAPVKRVTNSILS